MRRAPGFPPGEDRLLVLPNQTRRPARKHAFEEALEEARAMPDDDLEDFIDGAYANPVTGPAVGSIGEMAVASGYVAPASLARAYEAEEDEPEEQASPAAEMPHAEQRVVERPAEAAGRLLAALAERAHTPQELTRLRRRFAASNHPDKVAAEVREEALAAMADVNAAIDRALKPVRRDGTRR